MNKWIVLLFLDDFRTDSSSTAVSTTGTLELFTIGKYLCSLQCKIPTYIRRHNSREDISVQSDIFNDAPVLLHGALITR